MYGISDITDEGSWAATVIGEWGAREYYRADSGAEGVYYGLLGGIWDGAVMIGKMIGIYAQPGNLDPESSTLSLVEGAGKFYGEEININVDYLHGITLGFYIPDQEPDWSIWGISSAGTYSDVSANKMSIFNIKFIGDSITENGNSGGFWIGLGSGLLNKYSERITGEIRGMTLSDGIVGLISGDLLGVTNGSLNWEMVGLGQWEIRGTTQYANPANAAEFENLLKFGSFSAKGSGSFRDGGVIDATYMDAITVEFKDQNWGIWSANLGGTCDTETSSIFKIAIAGKTDPSSDTCILGTIDGTMKDNALAANFKGIWLESIGDGMIKAGAISGVADGYIDVSVPNGTWNAAAAGEWVEVTDLLKPDKLGFTLEQLNNFVSVPVTEVYSNILTGVNAGGMSATANIALYQNDIGRIWTMLLNGNYTTAPANPGWNLTVGSGSDSLNLTGGTWVDGKWTANVAGTVGGNTTTGQAGGTYGSGAWQGVGAGTWQAPVPPANVKP